MKSDNLKSKHIAKERKCAVDLSRAAKSLRDLHKSAMELGEPYLWGDSRLKLARDCEELCAFIERRLEVATT